MKVSELAELADITVRTIRHYHHLGLLAVPPVRGGFRDYDLAHLSRLLRIRWLVDRGMSLAAIGEVLPDDGPAEGDRVLGELHDTLAELDESLALLQARRDRIASLVERVEAGDQVTPLPPALARMYQRLLRRMPTERSRQAVEKERAMAVFFAARGLLPPMIGEFVEALTLDDEDDVVAMFVGLTELDEVPPERLDTARTAVSEPFFAVLNRHRSLLLGALGTIDTASLAQQLNRLTTLGFPGTEQRRLIGEWTAALADPDLSHWQEES